ncbi:MAG: hypothetical protein QG622_1551 [Actinomycetota bacterium]|nr:hypothetical protein [Actinomycetota bacterium]
MQGKRLSQAFAAAILVTTGVPAAAAAQPAVAARPAVAASFAVTAQKGPATLTTADVDAWLDGFLPAALSRGDIAGATVVVVKDGKPVTQRGYGYADVARRTPVDAENTLFRPGSVSKLFTWTAVMQLVELGKLDLDADINTYLDFRIPAREGKPITLRQVMTHTTGFEEQLKDIIGYDTATVPPLDELMKRWVPNRIYAPGTTPAYSNYATSLAGYIVQRVSRTPFPVYVEENIFKPLKMTRSTFRQPVPQELASFVSTGYTTASGRTLPFEFVGQSPAGALSATGPDMGRFMLAYLGGGAIDGGRILKQETVDEMLNTSLTVIPPLNRMMLGFFETNINGRQVVGHLGDTNAFHSSLHLFLKERTGLYVSVNSTGKEGAAGALRASLFQGFADRYFPGPAGSGPVDAHRIDSVTSTGHASELAGTWIPTRRSDSTFVSLASLLGPVTIGAEADGNLSVPMADGLAGRPQRWVEVEPFVWHSLDSHERLAAVVENGEVVRFSIDTVSPFMLFERPSWYQSPTVLTPLLIASLLALTLTVLVWPVRAIVRRTYRAPETLRGGALAAYRLSRVAALAMVLVTVGWGLLLTRLMSEVAFGAAYDPILSALQFGGLVAFAGGTLVAVWNLWTVWRGDRRWPAKVWSVVLVASGAVLVWTAAVYHLLEVETLY